MAPELFCAGVVSARTPHRLLNRRPVNIATVAVANKSARIAWALLTRKETYIASAVPNATG